MRQHRGAVARGEDSEALSFRLDVDEVDELLGNGLLPFHVDWAGDRKRRAADEYSLHAVEAAQVGSGIVQRPLFQLSWGEATVAQEVGVFRREHLGAAAGAKQYKSHKRDYNRPLSLFTII